MKADHILFLSRGIKDTDGGTGEGKSEGIGGNVAICMEWHLLGSGEMALPLRAFAVLAEDQVSGSSQPSVTPFPGIRSALLNSRHHTHIHTGTILKRYF